MNEALEEEIVEMRRRPRTDLWAVPVLPARRRQRNGNKLKLTKESNGTKESTFRKPRRKVF